MVHDECGLRRTRCFYLRLTRMNPSEREGMTQENKERHTHPMKAARTAARCWVFSIVQRKDRPYCGTALQGLTMGGTGRLSGKPERNAVPTKGDTMGMSRAGNRFPILATRQYIFSVHTVVHSKGIAAFFSSTHFYLFPNMCIPKIKK